MPNDVLPDQFVCLMQALEGVVDLVGTVALVDTRLDVCDTDAVDTGGVSQKAVTLGVE